MKQVLMKAVFEFANRDGRNPMKVVYVRTKTKHHYTCYIDYKKVGSIEVPKWERCNISLAEQYGKQIIKNAKHAELGEVHTAGNGRQGLVSRTPEVI